MSSFLAHSGTPEHPEGQPLIEHLNQVRALAEHFFPEGFLRSAAACIGIYHDGGKIKPAVQNHIRNSTNEKVDHSTFGAVLLSRRNTLLAPLLAPPILGHHGGLPDGIGGGFGRGAEARLKEPLQREDIDAFLDLTGLDETALTLPLPSVRSRKTAALELYMTVKMLHSGLVDADYLDTERFYDHRKAELRTNKTALSELIPPYDRYMRSLQENSRRPIDRTRAEIQRRCVKAASGPQGFYSLSVPTGGGKTLASLGFGLYHARAHPNIRRILYAIPFTSIVEQNADVFRNALGNDSVVEYHSAVRPPENGGVADLASENFDAPLIVTTNVQLFDSIFSNKPSKCRKLHNFQDSVIILDEMQALPDAVLRPCLAALDALVKDFRATVVICTATQPAYDSVWPEQPVIREIMEDPASLYASMRRTTAVPLGLLTDEALTDRLGRHNQVLCIVNSRAQAQRIAEALGGEKAGAYHLSTMMCPEHRRRRLALIRSRLGSGQVCRVVSTSVVEAGVDLSFPVVYRAAAGVDSLAQAAGRCNRNGETPGLAPVFIFDSPETHIPPETRRRASQTLTEIAPEYTDLLSPEAIKAAFRLRFGPGAELDRKAILPKILSHETDLLFPFAEIGSLYQTIQNAGEALFIPYDETARQLIAQLEYAPKKGGILRKLQQYSVNIYENQRTELVRSGYVRDLDGILILEVPEKQLQTVYTEEFGLNVGAPLAVLIY